MKRTPPLIAVRALLLVAAVGCTSRHRVESAFAQIIPAEDTNSSIGLVPITAEVSQSSGVFISLQLTNNSNRNVAFPPGYAARGFLWSEDKDSWMEIPNGIVFPDVGYELGPSGGDVPYIGTANFASTDPRLLAAQSLRIAVEGSLLGEDGSADGAIAAFTDVTLPGR